jgi:hypothetical protein
MIELTSECLALLRDRTRLNPLPLWGQSRHLRASRWKSALAPLADIPLRFRNRRSVPATEVIANHNGSHTPAIHQIVSTVTSSIGRRIVDAPTRILFAASRAHSHWGALTYITHRIRAESDEGPPYRRTDGVVRERFFRLSSRIRELARLDWTDGRNLRTELRWGRWRCR